MNKYDKELEETRSAAWSATWSAESAARSADSAARSARSAARLAEIEYQIDKVLEVLDESN